LLLVDMCTTAYALMHNLTPVYTPVSWSVNPPEIEDTPKNRRQMERLGKRLAAVMIGGHEANLTASLPMKRNRVAEEMGDEYVQGLDFDQLRFIAEMLNP
jgi:hypothetical protein